MSVSVELQHNTRLATVEHDDYIEDYGDGTWEATKDYDFDPTMDEGVFLGSLMP